MKYFFICIFLLISLDAGSLKTLSSKDFMWVSVVVDGAFLKSIKDGSVVEYGDTGFSLRSSVFRVIKSDYEKSKPEEWVRVIYEQYKIQKKYIVSVLDNYKVIDSNRYLNGCYYFTPGGDLGGIYIRPLKDGGVLFESDFYEEGSNWLYKNGKFSYGNLLVYKDLAVFRDGFGDYVVSSVVKNGVLDYFEPRHKTEFYYKLKCTEKNGFSGME